MKRLGLAAWAVSGLFGQTLFGQASSRPDALEIVRRSIDRDWSDFDSRKDYTYQEHYEQRSYTSDGHISHQSSETNEILVLSDWPYARLIARDGQPLSKRDALREQQKLDRTATERQHESAALHARHEKERAEDRRTIQQVPDAFTFRLAGMETVSGRPSWVIEGEPKPEFRPAESHSRIFKKVRAKVWIEQETYHWVKLDAEVIDTLTFGFGLLRVAPGGTLHFEQTRVNNEIWLPSHILIHADGRLALVKKLRTEIEIRYSGYQKFRADSKILETQER